MEKTKITLNPFDRIVESKSVFCGFIGETNAYEILFEGLDDTTKNEVWLSKSEDEYMPIPIVDDKLIIDESLTSESCVYTAVVVAKNESNHYIKKGFPFGISIEPSIGGSLAQIQVVPPAFQTEFDKMVEVRKTIENKLKNGEFTPNILIGKIKTVSPNEPAKVTRKGTNENPIFDFEIPQGVKGNYYYATFDIVGNELVMIAPDEYDSTTFEINENGELEAILNAEN